MLTGLQLTMAKFLGAGILVFGVYQLGSSHGSNAVQARWDKETVKEQAESLRIARETAEREKAHKAEVRKVTDTLDKAVDFYEDTLASVTADYAQRLSNSDLRAENYRKQAAAGPVESANLASHAAQLDRSLEEGRQLVKEFRATVELRDEQLKALGQQILADRAAIGN